MRSIIKTEKSSSNSQKKLSISPILTYINDDLRKIQQPPPKLRKCKRVINVDLNDSDYEYY